MCRILFYALVFFMVGCSPKLKKNVYQADIVELSDAEYHNNPDKLIESPNFGTSQYQKIVFEAIKGDSIYSVKLIPSKVEKDTLHLKSINLFTWIPAVPKFIQKDEYLTQIAIINQEWNRQQVKFTNGEFEVSTSNNPTPTRFDLARNCLNTGLWEVISYDGKSPLYHGWFDFPQNLFEKLFLLKNGFTFAKYQAFLLDWKDPKNEVIQLSLIRKVKSKQTVTFQNMNNAFYPIKGERLKKKPNIIYPNNPKKINDFLTDSTLFATFSPPGFYNKADPRKTELGKLHKLQKVQVKKVIIGKNEFDALELKFSHKEDDSLITHFILGGFKIDELPKLTEEEVNSGYQMPMGFFNHSFYEGIELAKARNIRNNKFYALITDKNGKWLDSHKIGIDGPLMHLDAENHNLLHFWILSFERHALVGHYVVDLEKINI